MNAFIQHQGKVVEDPRFEHMMALTLDPASGYKRGLIRCITSRSGDVQVAGYTDRSALYHVQGDSLEKFTVGDQLRIKNEKEIITKLNQDNLDFLGLEDPDIWIDTQAGTTHLFFTIPFVSKDAKPRYYIHLGHAVGPDLDSLEMTMPVLQADSGGRNTAKEVSIAPLNSQGIRLNLFESSEIKDEHWVSTVRIGIAPDMNAVWKFGDVALNPKERGVVWAYDHASPGPFFSKEFIDVGKGKVLGIMNGRSASQQLENEARYGMFSVGLMIYDFENGKIDWVSPEPFIQDSQAKTITFASQLVETTPGEALLYAHVDDSFVRAYTLYADGIRTLLP